MDAKTIKSVVFTAADGIAYVYPVTAPFVAIIEKIINVLDDSGAFPQVLSPESQLAMAAGNAAARSSAATTGIEAYKRGEPRRDTVREAAIDYIKSRMELADKQMAERAAIPTDPFASLKKE